jgi:hypothetical protein
MATLLLDVTKSICGLPQLVMTCFVQGQTRHVATVNTGHASVMQSWPGQ